MCGTFNDIIVMSQNLVLILNILVDSVCRCKKKINSINLFILFLEKKIRHAEKRIPYNIILLS